MTYSNTSFFSVKGGSGTTTTAAIFAMQVVKSAPTTIRTFDTDDMVGALGAQRGEEWVVAPMTHYADRGHVVNDLGTIRSTDELQVVHDFLPTGAIDGEGDGRLFMVLRCDYLGIRRALRMLSLHVSGIVLIEEPGRALHAKDVEDILPWRVVATIPYSESIARGVDAGLIGCGRKYLDASGLQAILPPSPTL